MGFSFVVGAVLYHMFVRGQRAGGLRELSKQQAGGVVTNLGAISVHSVTSQRVGFEKH